MSYGIDGADESDSDDTIDEEFFAFIIFSSIWKIPEYHIDNNEDDGYMVSYDSLMDKQWHHTNEDEKPGECDTITIKNIFGVDIFESYIG